jgi:hypothetical protein
VAVVVDGDRHDRPQRAERLMPRLLYLAVLHELLGWFEAHHVPGARLLRRLWAGPIPRWPQ